MTNVNTKIEWTDVTWSPVTGCTKVSAGCKHCYAEGIAHRFWGERKFTDVRTHADRLDEPLSWRKPSRVFVNSMSDLFHDDVPDKFIDQVFAVMSLAKWHTFQILTKRPGRMRQYVSQSVVGAGEGFTYGDRIARVACDVLPTLPDGLANSVAKRSGLHRTPWPLPNVWLGVSAEDQRAADERIPLLLRTPAALRFISAEPLLGPINLSQASFCLGLPMADGSRWLGSLPGIDWVIVGGESGPGARPCDVAWIRSIVEQCRAASVPVFVKQLGAQAGVSAMVRLGPSEQRVLYPRGCGFWPPEGGGNDWILRMKDRKGGDPTEWPEDLRVRQFPEVRP
ncbi:MAG: phage Gp37/Gp68 family protein [Planctomycetes bacterium]|nr:phage Gp37/Gp68 family protein [Planctomycetota bacterium]